MATPQTHTHIHTYIHTHTRTHTRIERPAEIILSYPILILSYYNDKLRGGSPPMSSLPLAKTVFMSNVPCQPKRHSSQTYIYMCIYVLFSKPACAAPVKKKTNSTSIISLLFFPHPSIRPHKKALEGGFGARILRYNAPSESFLLLQKSAISNPSLLDESGRERGDSPTHARSPGRDWPGELQPLKSRYIILCLASA